MGWRIELTATAQHQLRQIDRAWQRKILDYLEHKIAPMDNPRERGKALTGDGKKLWRFRVGDYRIICDIVEQELLIIAVIVGHRKSVYR